MRQQAGYGGMTVAFNDLPAGLDFTPFLKGQANDRCHCPHWGYVFEGSIKIVYTDGTEEITRAGEVFYWQPGHTAIVMEDVKLLDFSPSKELEEVMTQVNKNAEEMGG